MVISPICHISNSSFPTAYESNRDWKLPYKCRLFETRLVPKRLPCKNFQRIERVLPRVLQIKVVDLETALKHAKADNLQIMQIKLLDNLLNFQNSLRKTSRRTNQRGFYRS